jgi:hypothetical protein
MGILHASLTDATFHSLTLSRRAFRVVAMPDPDFIYISRCIEISVLLSTAIKAEYRTNRQI